MDKGKIKKIVRERGFGFIIDAEGKEVFFHRSGLTDGSFDALNEGQEVSYDIEKSPKGPRAINVSVQK